MKKFVVYSLLSAFCLSFVSCSMMSKKEDKKEEGKKKPSESRSSHRRYNS